MSIKKFLKMNKTNLFGIMIDVVEIKLINKTERRCLLKKILL